MSELGLLLAILAGLAVVMAVEAYLVVMAAVSFTPLPAPETRLDLVCRLFL